MAIPPNVRKRIEEMLHPGERLCGCETGVPAVAYIMKTTDGRDIGLFGAEDFVDEILAEYGVKGKEAA